MSRDLFFFYKFYFILSGNRNFVFEVCPNNHCRFKEAVLSVACLAINFLLDSPDIAGSIMRCPSFEWQFKLTLLF